MSYRIVFALVVLWVARATFAASGLQPSESRIILEDGATESSISFTNRGKVPLLVQIWVDDGESELKAAAKKASYYVNPPVFRVDPAGAQVVRIFLSNKSLPQDRESVSYLNALYVDPAGTPPVVKDNAVAAAIKFSIRHRIKIFYRPKTLSATRDRAPQPVVARMLGDDSVEITNPSAYHVTLAGQLSLRSGTDTIDVLDGMLSPFEKRVVKLREGSRNSSGWTTLTYRVLNDFGGLNSYEHPLEGK